ncbi:MAG: hypothetical protein WBA63_04865 [Thermomicrobiales bacterium]
MPKKKAEAPVPNLTPVPTPISAYQRKPRYKEYMLDLTDDGEQLEPLRVKVRSNLTFGELNDIPGGPDATFEEIFVAIAPHVIEWNASAMNAETGELEVVPAPAVAGPDALLVLDHLEALWLVQKVKYGYLGGDDRKKELTPPDSTDEPSSDPDLDAT